MTYNVIVTAYRNEARHLSNELKKYGKFTKTSFRDVLTGKLEDVKAFLEKINDEPPLSLARIVPIDEVIEFSKPEDLLNTLKNKLKSYKPKGTFRVTVERRGWKSEINSQEWEKQIGNLIEGKVKLTDPDTEIAIEIMDTTCGLTILDKETKEKYYMIKAH